MFVVCWNCLHSYSLCLFASSSIGVLAFLLFTLGGYLYFVALLPPSIAPVVHITWFWGLQPRAGPKANTHTHTHVLCMIWLGGYSSFPLLVVDLTQAMDIICVKPFTVSLIRKRGWTIGASNLGQKLPFITDVLNLETNSLSLSLVIENLYL